MHKLHLKQPGGKCADVFKHQEWSSIEDRLYMLDMYEVFAISLMVKIIWRQVLRSTSLILGIH